MTPNASSPAREGEETALSSPSRPTVSDPPSEGTLPSLTDVGPAADVTVVRGTPSAATIDEPPNPAAAFGKYELLGEIARGGMGVVHRARQHGLDRLVALKMVLSARAGEESAQRFLLEARAAAALDHPNVVPIYDTGEINGHPYFTMALIEGPNLRGYVDEHRPLPIPTVVSLFVQIALGVAHAHKHGIVHRDLKPANVLIDSAGRPRVTDFGLAKRSSVDTNLTATGQVVGTPQYMAPEQARDSKDVGPPADVYSLGAILYFMLTGRPPFQADNLTDLLLKVVGESPVPPRQLRPDVPADLEDLCLKCLAKDPNGRFADAEALFAALAPIADQYLVPSGNLTPSAAQLAFPRPLSAHSTPGLSDNPAPPLEATSLSTAAAVPAPQPAPNRKPLIVGLSVLALALVGVIAWLATRDNKPEVAKQEPTPVNVTPTPPGPLPSPPPPVLPVPLPVEKTNKFAWPAATRKDFGIKAELTAVGAKKGADGTIRLTAGTPMTIHIKADRDCRVRVWTIDAADHEDQVFPNDDDTDNHLKAGVERTVPGNNSYTLQTTPTEGAGVERLYVLATIGDHPPFPPGVKAGRFSVYTNEADRVTLASTVRGIVHQKANAPNSPAVSAVEFRYRVEK